LFTESHRDLGGGDPFGFTFGDGVQSYTSNKHDWDPGDAWSRTNWWDIPPYTNYLNAWMMGQNGSFQCLRWDGGVSTKFNDKNVQGKHSLWAKSSEGHYIPINCFESQANLAKLVTLLYMSLYYVNTDTTTKDLAVVNNINYMTSYSETWNVAVQSGLSISNIQNSVVLVSSDGNRISL
jgi:hypothetical protein